LPVKDAVVSLIVFEKDDLYGETIKESSTDANGFAHFKFNAHEDWRYYVRAVHDEYYNNLGSGSISYDPISKYSVSVHNGQRNNLVQKLRPKVFIDIKVINQTPYDNNDKIEVSYPTMYLNWYLSNASNTFIGKSINEEISTWVLEEKYYTISWSVTKNSILTTYTASLNCKSHQTNELIINY